MSYKVTLEIYVNEQTTYPTIAVESVKPFNFSEARPEYGLTKTTDTEALEGVLTRTREFAETLLRGVPEENAVT